MPVLLAAASHAVPGLQLLMLLLAEARLRGEAGGANPAESSWGSRQSAHALEDSPAG
jgi:hypothetical protein